MSLKINIVNCPSCGAAIPITEGHSQLACSYCGTKLNITNENEHIIRHVDEAQVRQVEVEQMIRLRELEMEEKRRKFENIKLIVLLSILFFFLLISAIGFIFSITGMEISGILGLECTAFILLFSYTNKKNKEKGEKSSKTTEIKQLGSLNNTKAVFSVSSNNNEKVFGNHFCGNCGTRLLDDARFCHKCGHIAGKLPVPPKVGKQKRKIR